MSDNLGKRTPHTLLVEFGYFTTTAHLSVIPENLGKLLQGFHHTIRRLIENHGAHLILQGFKIGLSALFLRNESFEAETVAWQTR